MRVPEPDEEVPVAWTAVRENLPVLARDGIEFGVVAEMAGAEDIFHGVVVRSGPTGQDVMIPAERVGEITNKHLTVDMSPDEIRALPPYVAGSSYHLGGTVGSDDVGWVQDEGTGR